MNPILIILPILTILMFELGLTVDTQAFKHNIRNPKAMLLGLLGQIIILPVFAFGLGLIFDLNPIFFLGLMLIACSPGGSTSNAFTMLAKGDTALSISMTLLSSVITLITLPLIIQGTLNFVNINSDLSIDLPIGQLLAQNLLLVLIPLLVGILLQYKTPKVAQKIALILKKITLPALVLLVAIFFFEHRETIISNIGSLGGIITIFIISALICAYILSRIFRLSKSAEKSIIIEVGMQNAAQSIAIASSPFIFNNTEMAIPAIIYSLLMNIILLGYLFIVKRTS